jgi:hypothetical protein
VPGGSYNDETERFALTPPESWAVLTSQNYAEAARQAGIELPKSTIENLQSTAYPKMTLIAVRGGAIGAHSPTLNVVITGERPPHFKESSKDDVFAEVTKIYSAAFGSNEYQPEGLSIVQVDNLTALRSAHRISFNTEHERVQVRQVQTIVPGAGRGYVITCTAPSHTFDRYAEDFDAAVASFRVTERPTRVTLPSWIPESVAKKAMLGLAVGALLAALRWFFSR